MTVVLATMFHHGPSQPQPQKWPIPIIKEETDDESMASAGHGNPLANPRGIAFSSTAFPFPATGRLTLTPDAASVYSDYPASQLEEAPLFSPVSVISTAPTSFNGADYISTYSSSPASVYPGQLSATNNQFLRPSSDRTRAKASEQKYRVKEKFGNSELKRAVESAGKEIDDPTKFGTVSAAIQLISEQADQIKNLQSSQIESSRRIYLLESQLRHAQNLLGALRAPVPSQGTPFPVVEENED